MNGIEIDGQQPIEEDDWLEDQGPAATSTAYDPTSQREWTSLSEKFTNDGYREGIEPGKLSTLQSGFDQGYALATPAGRRLGHLRGRTASLLSLLNPPLTPTAKSRIPTLSLSSVVRDQLIEDVRALGRELSRLKMEDVVGRDIEAEEHAKTHDGGEAGEAKDWEEGEGKEMDDLEERMGGMSREEKGKKEEKKLVELGPLEESLKELKARAGLGRKPEAGVSIRMDT